MAEKMPENEASGNAILPAPAAERSTITVLDLSEARERPKQFLEHLQESHPAFFEKLAQQGPNLTK